MWWRLSISGYANHALPSCNGNCTCSYILHSASSRACTTSSFLPVVSMSSDVLPIAEYRCQCNTVGPILSNQDFDLFVAFQWLHNWKIVFISTSPVRRLLITALRTGIATVSWYSSINEHITSHAQSEGRWAYLRVVTVGIPIQRSFPQYGSMTQERSWIHHYMAFHKLNRENIITRKTGIFQWRYRWILAPLAQYEGKRQSREKFSYMACTMMKRFVIELVSSAHES